jgi:polyphosphate kinase
MMTKTETFDTSFTQNRELSWLMFNRRVLKEAEDLTVPLMERLKFLAIFQSNLDEFYMIRVGSLGDIGRLKQPPIDNKSGMSIKEQLEAIYKATVPLIEKKDKVFTQLRKQLELNDIHHCEISQCSSSELKHLENVFKRKILPLLSPLVIDRHHPFPHLLNKQKVVVAMVKNKENLLTLGMIPVSDTLDKMIFLPRDSISYVLTEKVIQHFFPLVFDKYQVSDSCIVSITRNADIHPEDEGFDFDLDFRVHMKLILKKRSRLAPVRMEVEGELDEKIKRIFKDRVKLSDMQIFVQKSPISFDYIFDLVDKLSPKQRMDLTDPPFQSASMKISMLDYCMRQDLLLFYPYDDFELFIQFLKESASSTDVVSIKISLYRLAANSKVIQYLCDAAQNGKEVTVLIELRARFDEKNNIEWAEILEKAGCNLIYGFEEVKVHGKLCLITLKKADKISYITQIGTGNYNEKTAKLYSDLSLFTANPMIAQDAMLFFKNMAVSNLQGTYNLLWVAPFAYKDRLMDMIDAEIEKVKNGQSGRIIFKANSLSERDIIDKLSQASQAGVKIDLIIRGICCLLPNVKGRSENIEVTSVVGRFLEHARIYAFGEGEDAKIWISSGDLMTRSLTRRVEVAVMVLDKGIKQKILHLLSIMLSDNVKGHRLMKNGRHQRIKNDQSRLNSQEYFIEEARNRIMVEVQPTKPVMIKKSWFARLIEWLKG